MSRRCACPRKRPRIMPRGRDARNIAHPVALALLRRGAYPQAFLPSPTGIGMEGEAPALESPFGEGLLSPDCPGLDPGVSPGCCPPLLFCWLSPDWSCVSAGCRPPLGVFGCRRAGQAYGSAAADPVTFLIAQKSHQQLSCSRIAIHADAAHTALIRSSRIRALRTTISFRMQATRATLASLPRARSC